MKHTPISGISGDKTGCSGCAACMAVCPVHAISMELDDEKFYYPRVNTDICVDCGQCIKVCPMQTIQGHPRAQSVYACHAKDTGIRDNGSSGGLFGLLAKNTIEKGGIVFGAAFDGGFNLSHLAVDNRADIIRLCRSKYLQSDTRGVYNKVKAYLDANKPVFFSGTPCQVAALKNYLGCEYKNLLTADIVCHGVPSNQMFIDSVKYEESRTAREITDFCFRVKNSRIKHPHVYSYHYHTASNKVELKVKYGLYYLSPFYLSFKKALTYRPACYICPYATLTRPGDITLGDFWGVENHIKDMDTQDGVSVLIANTNKGIEAFREIEDFIKAEKVDAGIAAKYNGCLSHPTIKPALRDSVMELYKKEGFSSAAKKYMRPRHPLAYMLYFKLPRRIRDIRKKVLKNAVKLDRI